MLRGICIIIKILFLINTTSIFSINRRVTSVSGLDVAIAASKPGDTITLANKTWNDVSIKFWGVNGTDSNPIVLQAETYGQVVITGKSKLSIGGNHLIVDGLFFKEVTSEGNIVEFRSSSSPDTYAHHSRLTRTLFLNCNPPDNTTKSFWVNIYGTYNRVDHCYFEGKTNLSPTLVVTRAIPDANYARIDSNYFAGRPNLGTNGGETIRIGTGIYSLFNSNTVVEYNLFEACNGEIEIISNKSCENIIRYNTFRNNEGTVTIRQGQRCDIYGNFFLGNGLSNTGGIRIFGRDHRVFNNYFSNLRGSGTRSGLSLANGWAVPDSEPEALYFPIKNLIVANNTFVNCLHNINLGTLSDEYSVKAPDSIFFSNNVFYVSDVSSPFITQVSTPTNVFWNSNYMYGADLGIVPPTSGINLTTNPLLNLHQDGIYRIDANSPLINASSVQYPFITTDMDGQLRGVIHDIGADEYASTPKINYPLTPADLGMGNISVITSVTTLSYNPSDLLKFDFFECFPNPFHSESTIRYGIPTTENVKLVLYDLFGKECEILVNALQQKGEYSLKLNANKYSLSTGMYFCRIDVGDYSQTIKLFSWGF